MRKALDYILTRFPDHRSKIIGLYNNDEDFRILCEDYFSSTQSLDESRHNEISDRQIVNDFLQINLDLEKEIVHLLKDRLG